MIIKYTAITLGFIVFVAVLHNLLQLRYASEEGSWKFLALSAATIIWMFTVPLILITYLNR